MNQLLHTRFPNVAENTIDYWMRPDSQCLDRSQILSAFKNATWSPTSTLQLYLHVPYCAQKCTFCAFSGGNSLDFKTAEKYASLLIWQMKEFLSMSPSCGKPIASVNIGGGSPDLLKGSIGKVLSAIKTLDGFTENTEISVEFTLSTVTDEFIDELLKHNVTKVSFGVQVIDPEVRRYLQMPTKLNGMDEVCEKLSRGVPIINADLVTGFPGQTLTSVINDLKYLIDHPRVNSISSYLLTPGAAPKLLADIQAGIIPPPPTQEEQALFRLHTYAELLRHGWVRKGTNTYMNPKVIEPNAFSSVAGNECIGARRYEDFLIGCGAQAISSIPGARIENTVDINQWMNEAESGRHSFALEKCSLESQYDAALWVFPLMANGLLKEEFDSLIAAGRIDDEQAKSFEQFISEGLIIDNGTNYNLSIIGEVFMGHLVKTLKKIDGQEVISEYIKEGYLLGNLLKDGKIPRNNSVNDRQKTKEVLR
jgi:coproporphyrinogen III oxidase-like Fe-S oxidoreductase